MKLRFRGNSLRLRLNQREVAALARGETLEEKVEFPAGSTLRYRLTAASAAPAANFAGNAITISVPGQTARQWHESEEIGVYFRTDPLEVAIEKDLECVDAREEERDPFAYARKAVC
jgi:hypothetical protein